MEVIVKKNYEEMSKAAATLFAAEIMENPKTILGMATGSTPVGLYKELVKMYEAGDLDFSQVTTFNLDEYIGLAPEHDQSYHYFMNDNLFDHVNINKENVHVPDGFNVGDIAEVFFDVESYQGTKKDGTTDWFTSVRGYKMQKIEAQNNAPQGGMQAAANNPFPPQAPAAGSAPIPPAQPSGTNTSDAPF